MEKYIDYEMCKKCGGVCCKQNGCVYAPSDFESMKYSYLKNIINQGKISISGQPVPFLDSAWTFIPYLRARNFGAPIVDLFSKGGPCINLTDVGCTLSENTRPAFGLLVEPTQIGGPCEKRENNLAEDWLYYSDVLSQLIKYYTHNELIDELIKEIEIVMDIIRPKLNNKEQLSTMEKQNAFWYYNILANKPYYSPEEVAEYRLML